MKRVWKSFLSLPKNYQIVCIVLLLHGAFLLFAMTDHFFSKKQMRKQAMVVRTVMIEKPAVTTLKSQSATPTQSKKTAPRTVPKKPVPSIVKKSPAPPTNESLFKELAKSLETLTPSKKTKTAPLSIPQPISIKTELEPIPIQNGSYAEHVIQLLTNQLDLPEFGAVKILLKINHSGSVINCEILEEKSRKNGQFLKNRLRELTFPCFNDFGLSDSQLEFTITFQNLRI